MAILHRMKFYYLLLYATWLRISLCIIFGALLISLIQLYNGMNGSVCHGLMEDGEWLPNGQWQAKGCIPLVYSMSNRTASCLQGDHIVIMGDSRMRLLFHSFIRTLEMGGVRKRNSTLSSKVVHKDMSWQGNDIRVDFVWAPILSMHSSDDRTTENHTLWKQTSTFNHTSCLQAWSNSSVPAPTLLLVGSGLWEMKSKGYGHVDEYRQSVTSVAEYLRRLPSKVVWNSIAPLQWEKLSESRRVMTNTDIINYNIVAASVLRKLAPNVAILSGLAFESMYSNNHDSEDGLHWDIESMPSRAHFDVLLNFYCNSKPSNVRRYGYRRGFRLSVDSRACCVPLPSLTYIQIFLGVAFVVSMILWLITRNPFSKIQEIPHSTRYFNLSVISSFLVTSHPLWYTMSRLGCALFFIWLCDGTSLFTVEHKVQSTTLVFIGLAVILFLGCTSFHHHQNGSLLSRGQTDEWKGWMQLLVITCQYFKTSSVLSPIAIRVCVAAYLFQTGYGHTVFFLKKSDFSLYRIAQVLFRLNFVSIIISLCLNRPYSFYYFVPLSSLWFIFIYLVMVTYHHTNTLVLMVMLNVLVFAICCAAMSTSSSMFHVSDTIFTYSPLDYFFFFNESIEEWCVLFCNDRFAPAFGMLIGILSYKSDSLYGFFDSPVAIALPMFIIVIICYVIFNVSQQDYNVLHPYISLLLILSFVVLRNALHVWRSYTSKFFNHCGQISLELYLVHYHILLSNDGNGILVFFPGARMINAIMAFVVLLCICQILSDVTNKIAVIILPPDNTKRSVINSIVFSSFVVVLFYLTNYG